MTIIMTELRNNSDSRSAFQKSEKPSTPHSLVLEDRRRLTASGVSNVDSYDDQTIAANTQLGLLVIRGRELHMEKLSTETGELTVTGEIASMSYLENRPQGSFFSRLFR